MKRVKPVIIIVLAFQTFSCSTGYEAVMPYRNIGYRGDRLLPVNSSDSGFSMRIWINNSTSIDRIISIYKDFEGQYRGRFFEIGSLDYGKKNKDYYKSIKIVPKHGFEMFRQELDSLDLFALNDQEDFGFSIDQPFSLYVVEIKDKELYHIFKFNTNYPIKTKVKNKYDLIEGLIFDEFDIYKYFKFKPVGN